MFRGIFVTMAYTYEAGERDDYILIVSTGHEQVYSLLVSCTLHAYR